jgi:hypothetical protein
VLADNNQFRPDTLPLRNPPAADPRFPGENDLDPFQVLPSSTDTPAVTLANTPPPLYMLYLLVAWLHTQCKLAFTACSAVLVVVAHILMAAGVTFGNGERSSYVSLTSVINNLGVEPVFQVLPICPLCMEPYPASRPTDTACDRCSTPLFKRIPSLDRRRRTTEDIVRPVLQCASMSVEAQLRAILEIPGMEDEMEQWRDVPRTPGVYNDMFDGRVPQQLKGPDGRPFFENPKPANSTELRIGGVLGFDW